MPNVYKICPKMISLEKLKILTPLQKFPKNVRDLGKLIVAQRLWKVAQSQLNHPFGHTAIGPILGCSFPSGKGVTIPLSVKKQIFLRFLSRHCSVTRCWTNKWRKICPKRSLDSFFLRIMFFTLTQKVIINFGYFLKKICHKDFSKIAQSGHT